VPVLPLSLIEPAWTEFAALLDVDRAPEFSPTHPWGCHRRRVPDRVVFELVLAALVHGSGYERIAVPGCSDRTIRRRVHDWARRGLADELHRIAVRAFEKMIGLQLGDIAVDGCITKAPCGGDRAGRSPVDRGKGGLKRSVLTEDHGLPVVVISAPANRHDSPLLEPTLDGLNTVELPAQVTAYLDAGYDSAKTRALLDQRGFDYVISRKGTPLQAGQRWKVERTHSWMNGYGKLRRCTEKNTRVVNFYLALAAALTVIRALIREARTRYRWPTRPTTRRLR
jgi:transposase